MDKNLKIEDRALFDLKNHIINGISDYNHRAYRLDRLRNNQTAHYYGGVIPKMRLISF